MVFASVLALGLGAAPDDILFHADTVRDLLLARDCTAAVRCISEGPPSSAFLAHGFFWHRFLSLFYSFAIPLRLVPASVAVLHAFGILMLFSVMEGTSSRLGAVAATAAYCLATFDQGLFDPLWTPTLIPALVNASLWTAYLASRASGRGRLALACMAFFVLSFGTQTAIQIFFFLPGVLLFLIWEDRRRGMARWVAWGAGLIGLMSLSWLLVSPDAFYGNLRFVGGCLSGNLSPDTHLWSFRGISAASAGRFALFAAGLLACLFALWRFGRISAFERLLGFGSLSYLTLMLPVALMHDSPYRYYVPITPFIFIFAARAVQPLLLRHAGWAAAVVGLLILGAADRFAELPHEGERSVKGTLTIGEIRSLTTAMGYLGYDANAAYGHLSGGPGIHAALLSGLWLEAPCLIDTPFLGAGAGEKDRLAVLAVSRGFPVPPAMRGIGWRRVPGVGRDFFILPFKAFVRMEEFSYGEGAVRFGVDNLGFEKRCWDGTGLAFNVRRMLPKGKGMVEIPVRVPRGASERVLYLPAVTDSGRVESRCAGRIVAVRGIPAQIRSDGRAMGFSGSDRALKGSVRISWPIEDSWCFSSPGFFYPMPMLELPKDLFEELSPFL